MADNNNSNGFWKPWKDGFIENTIKTCGVIFIFLFASGVMGAGYNPIATNPYVWGVYVRGVFSGLSR